jgi:DNA-binding CsgD family transcriptional regulator
MAVRSARAIPEKWYFRRLPAALSMTGMTADAQARAAGRIRHLAGRGLDVAAFWRECNEVLAAVVPHYLAPCWFTFDPVSLLITSHYDPVIPQIATEFLAHEYGQDDVLKMADVARLGSGVATIHEATGGDPSRSPGWRAYVQPYGGDQQLMVALRAKPGEAWGLLALYREAGQREFSRDEIGFLSELAGPLAEGARRGLLIGEAADPEGPNAPSLIVLDEDGRVHSMTPGAEAVLAELPGGDGGQGLPACVLSVAGRALRSPETLRTTEGTTGGTTGEVAVARVRAGSGQWMILHGAPLLSDGSRRVAVIVERGDPDRLAPLLMAAYGLTDREKDVTRLVLQGEMTSSIAARLFVSPQTVQQHLKSIFDKTGVRSRRELVGKVFFAHYEPRVRDNERRAAAERPFRGGPAAPGQADQLPEPRL